MNINKKFFLALLFLFSLNNQAKGLFLIENLIKLFLSPNSLLIEGSTSNNIDEMIKAIENGANINTQNNELRTSLHLVIWHKNLEAFNLLMENGIDIRIREEDGHTGLHASASVNFSEATMILIQKSGEDHDYINEENNLGNTPLHLAALENSCQSASVLIEANANVNHRNRSKKTPLHYAVIRKNIEMIKLLIIAGARINIKDIDKRTPFSYANREIKAFIKTIIKEKERQIKRKRLEIRLRELEIQNIEKEKLLELRQEEIRNQIQNTTSVQSQLKRHLQQKRFNQKRAAIAEVQKHLRKTLEQNNYRHLKHLTKMENNSEYKLMKFRENFLPMFDNFLLNINGPINELPTKKELMAEFENIMFMQGISIPGISAEEVLRGELEKEISFKHLVRNFRDADGNTVLHLFAMYGKYKFIPVFILNGISINIQNDHQETPLHLATEFHNIKTVEILIYLGANPNIQSFRSIFDLRTGRSQLSQTALTIAVEHGFKEIFYILINSKNINLDIQTEPFNQTALHFAVELHNEFFIKELLMVGANPELRTRPSSKFPQGATAQDLAFVKRQYASELYACFDTEFAESIRVESDLSLIIDLDIYRNIDTEIEQEINNFIEWIQENNDIDFSSIVDKNRNNIFHYMAKYNHPQIQMLIPVFLELGVDINARNRKGFTPLHIAIFYGNMEMAQTFVNSGAEIIEF